MQPAKPAKKTMILARLMMTFFRIATLWFMIGITAAVHLVLTGEKLSLQQATVGVLAVLGVLWILIPLFHRVPKGES